ncbi:MAG: trypsin-like peptidase domain-containing protein [Nitrospinae bacterium]|nr:trypsin-like peptidase domain-containing protein [Nitrospinota bacterium]
MLERRLKELFPAVGPLAGRARASEERIASVLQKIGKNLILERTRGLKEVELYRRAAPAVVLVVTNEGFGSGAIIDRQGHVITNWHVVSTFPHVVVVFKPKDGTELKKELAFQATVEKVDHVTDLALLQINTPPKTFTSLPLGDASTLAVGQDVHAIGHPEGEVWTYTKGIISQVRAKNS